MRGRSACKWVNDWMAPEIYWAKIAALGQIAGAVATFLAVVVALILARSERSFRLRIKARYGALVDVAGQTDVMTIEVCNTGLRKVTVTGFGWTTGYVNSLLVLPKRFRLRSIFQIDDYTWHINPRFPWHLEPGETKMTHMRRQEFVDGMTERHPDNLYRKLPWSKKSKLFRHRVYVSISSIERIYFGKVDSALTSNLEERYAELLEADSAQTSSTSRP